MADGIYLGVYMVKLMLKPRGTQRWKEEY